MPFYSSYPTEGRLVNTFRSVLDDKNITSFKFSKISDLSPTTTRKIYSDKFYIPSPEVLERICLVLDVQPGDILRIASKMEATEAVCSGV